MSAQHDFPFYVSQILYLPDANRQTDVLLSLVFFSRADTRESVE